MAVTIANGKGKQRQDDGEQQVRAQARDIAARVFRSKHGLQLAPGVLDWLEEFSIHHDRLESREMVQDYEALVVGMSSDAGLDVPTRVTVDLLDATYEKLRMAADRPVNDLAGDAAESARFLKVVNAQDMPPWRWNEEAKTFEL